MKKFILLILVLILMLLPMSVFAASNYTPMYYPDLETAFKIPAWKSWQSPSGNDEDSIKVPTTWHSPTTANYTEFLKVPAWKSWKPLSFSNWDMVFRIPWR